MANSYISMPHKLFNNLKGKILAKQTSYLANTLMKCFGFLEEKSAITPKETLIQFQIYEGGSESNAFYLIMMFHDIRGRYEWHGSKG